MALKSRIDTVVLPGEALGIVDAAVQSATRLGPGLRQELSQVLATKAGVLRFKPPDTYFIENNQKRYVPALDDLVVGVIADRNAEGWKVDLGCHQLANLSMYGFEGATKKNRKNLAVGSLVYARVTVANRDMEPELACMNSKGKSDGFGELIGGYLFKCTTGLALIRYVSFFEVKSVFSCLAEDSTILAALGKELPFEVAVGINGRIWVRSVNSVSTILIANAVMNSEHMNRDQIADMVTVMIKRSKQIASNQAQQGMNR